MPRPTRCGRAILGSQSANMGGRIATLGGQRHLWVDNMGSSNAVLESQIDCHFVRPDSFSGWLDGHLLVASLPL